MMIHDRVALAFLTVVLIAAPCRAAGLEIAALAEGQQVLYSRDIAPVLKKNCVACHNESEEEAGVNLESVAKMRASDLDDLLVSGEPESSRLFLLAAHLEEPVMPPEENDVSASPFSPMELALLKRWIETGAEVDSTDSPPEEFAFQSLPASLRTNYSAAMTSDGRLSVVSFGNRLQVFGKGAREPIAELDQDGSPAHDDFVQDVWINPSGDRIVSSGFRNVKFWELNLFKSVSLPKILSDEILAITMNASGQHVATLTPQGELSVAEIGKTRWSWMRGFDYPSDRKMDPEQPPRLALDGTGDSVAVGYGSVVRVASSERKHVDTLKSMNRLTVLRWTSDGQLVTGDSAGMVSVWTRSESEWIQSTHRVFNNPVKHLNVGMENPSRWIAIDSEGNLSLSSDLVTGFKASGQLPVPAVEVVAFPSGDGLWITTESGEFGTFDLEKSKWSEIAKQDPAANHRYQSLRWNTLVGQKLVAANEKDLTQAETNVTAEEKSLATLTKTIESKTKDRDDKKRAANEARAAAQSAEQKLDVARKSERESNAQRASLQVSIKKLDTSIAELEDQLEELKRKRSVESNKLKKIPEAKKLTEATKAATDALDKAKKAADAKQLEFESAKESLTSTEETKIRSETRLKGLKSEAERWKEVVAQSKADQIERKELEAAAKVVLDSSKPAGLGLAFGAKANWLLLGSGSENNWNAWSRSGDWLASVADLAKGSSLAAAGAGCILLNQGDGMVAAMQPNESPWMLKRVLGSASGQSPFADRVLCMDVDPAGQRLATGGGFPSRSGELMVWDLSDGQLLHSFSKPHADTVTSMRFSPDGSILATGGADRMIKLWDVRTWELIKTLEGHTHHVSAIGWHVNGRQLASGAADATVKVWDIETGKATRTISGLKSEVTKLVFVGTEDRVAMTCGDGYFRIYRTDNGRREANAIQPGGYLYALDADDEGTRYVVGGASGAAVVVDKSGKQLQELGPE